MPWAAAAAVAGAVISSDATRSASNKQADASNNSIAEQQRQYDQTREDQAPYRAVGADALAQLKRENNTPLDPGTVQLDPGYIFARNQGQEAIDRKMAAAGGRVSGAAFKAASEYNTDYGTSGYSTAYNRVNQARSDRLNRLAALAGIGQTATQQTGAAGQNTANQISTLTSAQGNAAGAAQLAQGNIWAGAGNQIAALYGRNPSTGFGGVQAAYSQTAPGQAGFGTGAAYGNQDYGSYI